METRKFKGGAWDLRKDERRQQQLSLDFPDRRQKERRLTTLQQQHHERLIGAVSWVDKSGLDA